MIKLIREVYECFTFQEMMLESWFMNFVIQPENSTTEKQMSNIVLPEFTDMGWCYMSVANIFEDKLSSAERIVLGYLLATYHSEDMLKLNLEDRDRRQLLNALLAVKQYSENGCSNIMLPLDMATSALILKSAMYRCTTTMKMVGLTTEETTLEGQIREPVSDSYTRLYQAALDKLPPAAREKAASNLTRDELKKTVIMPD